MIEENVLLVLRPHLRIPTRALIKTKQYYEMGLFKHNQGHLTLHSEVKHDFDLNLFIINKELALRN